MTVLSKPTIEVLKNFCSINKSLVINPGNRLSTLSINKNILVYADVEESFDSQLSIYDLGVFLGGLTLFEQPTIDTSKSNYVQVGETTDNFCYCFKVENLKLLLADYNVTISKSNVALFQGDGIKYFIALEPNA